MDELLCSYNIIPQSSCLFGSWVLYTCEQCIEHLFYCSMTVEHVSLDFAKRRWLVLLLHYNFNEPVQYM